jgi:membrane protease YdiL (CAAX protease family)
MRDVSLALVIVIGSIALMLAAVVSPAWAAFGEDSTEGRLASALSTVVAEVLAAALVYRLILRPRSVTGWMLGLRPPLRNRVSGDRGFGVWWFLVAVGACFVAFALLATYVALVTELGADFLEPPEEQIPGELFSHWIVIVALGLGVLVAAPLFEELFFRGFAFAAIRKSTGFLPAAIGSGILFSLAHLDIGFIVPFAAIGAWFAFLYWRTDSLYTSMLCHFLFNLVGFITLVVHET